MIKKIKIKNIEFENNLILAPLAGICLKPFRLSIKRMGAGLVCNEMVASYAIIYGSKKTFEMIDVSDILERPVSVQIFGNNPDMMAESARILQDIGVELLDINMGCPANKVVSSGSGSALLKDLPKIAKIVANVRKAINIPISVKIRAGWDMTSINAEEVAHIIEGEGSDMITVHARTRSQKFGDFDWDIIRKVKQKVRIPVIGNGNIFTPFDVKNMYDQTNCDGFMIGRASCTNPWIFRQILDYFDKKNFNEASNNQRLDYIKIFSKEFVAYVGQKYGIFEVRKFIVWLTKGLPNGKFLREEFFKIQKTEDIDAVIELYRRNNL